ncbi:MAG: pyruvate formate lyase family protein [Eubacteriales bacterium]|nr:pyruvate formate lyase family protein [Eubacteriales bacterium]
MNRIDALRAEALNRTVSYDAFFYGFFRSYVLREALPRETRYAQAFYDALRSLAPCISDGELIVGKCAPLPPEEQADWEASYRETAQNAQNEAGWGQDSHMAVDYDLLLRCGVRGLIARIDGLLDGCEDACRPFYTACRTCLEAVLVHAEAYARAAAELAARTEEPVRKKELERIAAVCGRVPAYPAESFYEAVQSVHFLTYCLSMNPFRVYGFQQFQLGRPDRYLLPYYRQDLQRGRITPEEAQLLLDCLGIQINNRVCNGLSSGYMVGGRDASGEIVQNELTLMCMQVIDDIRLVYPAVGLCCTEGMDERLLDCACRILSHGRSHPALFNDDLITRSLAAYGVPADEACSYIHSTCVEITPVGSSNAWVASPYTNMPQLLLDVMDREYESLDALLGALFDRLDDSIRRNFEEQNALRRHRCAHSMNPLLSCFVHDCLERGTDIEQGGARYNWIMPSFVGMANLVDSLYVLGALVFDGHELSVREFKAILDENFEGHEALRRRIAEKLPKYGNDLDEVDAYMSRLTEHIAAECAKYTCMFQNGRLIPSVFCWVMHDYFGQRTGATPDGRIAGFPLGDGSGPCQGRETHGPTASILSSTKWDHQPFLGGVAVNIKFPKSSAGENALPIMKSLIRVYLARGGFELQINVVDRETLEAAVREPELYRDLVVRIGGYSDYFVKLSPSMQQELLLRTEHGL